MVNLALEDGFITIDGSCPGLTKKLRYFKRELSLVGYQRKVVSGYEDLYETVGGKIVTMPGFAHLCLDHMRKNGIPFTVEDHRTPMPSPNPSRAFESLRPYQVQLVARMLKSGGGILQAATGAGKTAISAAIIRAYDRNELISRGTPTCVFACPDRDINRKNFEEFQRWLPDREIGMIMSGAKNVLSDDVVCCTLDSLEHIDPETVGILIVDEMHSSASVARSDRITAFRKAAKWGVSATPTGRFDGGDKVMEGLYGPIVAKFTYQDGVAAGALVPVTVVWLEAPEPICGMKVYNDYVKRETKVKKGSTSNDDFCKLAAEVIRSVPGDMQVLGMMQYVDQMQLVHRYCPEVGCVHAITSKSKIAQYPGMTEVSPKERKRLYDEFRDGNIHAMLATHVWSTGVDFKNLSVVVNIGGGASDILVKQVVGRASRKTDGKDHAYLVDFRHTWDVDSEGKPGPLLSMDNSRRKSYKTLGFEQVSCRPEEMPFLTAR